MELSRRDYLAGMAMQTFWEWSIATDQKFSDEIIASAAVEMADALIAELNKTPPTGI